MKLIGENIHIISKSTRSAIENRDTDYIVNMAKKQVHSGIDWIDLNIGPARKNWAGAMRWLTSIILNELDVNLSFDSTNMDEIEAGLKFHPCPADCVINSASGDPERLENMTKLAANYGSHLIALTLSNETGIPKDPDGRIEIASVILEKAMEYGIDNSKIFLDPLVLPVNVDQSQVMAALDSIRVFKESFDPPVMTTIGLSNVSNGSPKEIRPLINRIFCVMAMGCGLDSAIVDAFDTELIRTVRILETQRPEKESDKLIINLHNLMSEFGEFEDLSYNKDNPEEVEIYKTAKILFNKNIYAHNYAEC
ncbi:MAG TPA: dihydropteroate synthase [Candidatus Gastranaerophilales bacterium]|nr:dihydropteroate synthase [Candidatus Gastranaerophilales bacterium]